MSESDSSDPWRSVISRDGTQVPESSLEDTASGEPSPIVIYSPIVDLPFQVSADQTERCLAKAEVLKAVQTSGQRYLDSADMILVNRQIAATCHCGRSTMFAIINLWNRTIYDALDAIAEEAEE